MADSARLNIDREGFEQLVRGNSISCSIPATLTAKSIVGTVRQDVEIDVEIILNDIGFDEMGHIICQAAIDS